MEDQILKELAKIKQATLIGVKKALTMDDAVLITGLSKSHLYKLVSTKQIPYYKSMGGKMTYFEKVELEKWLLGCRVSTVDEIEQSAANYCATGKFGGR